MTQPTEPTLQNLEEYLKIDMSALDDSLMQQPEIFRQVSDAYALAVSKRDAAKENLERVDSELYTQIREEAEQEGRKVTEKMIEAEINQSPDHQQAHKEWLEQKLEADQWSALKDSFHQRSHMLRDLVSLFVSGYFSDPTPIQQEEQNLNPQDQLSSYNRRKEAKARKGEAVQ